MNHEEQKRLLQLGVGILFGFLVLGLLAVSFPGEPKPPYVTPLSAAHAFKRANNLRRWDVHCPGLFDEEGHARCALMSLMDGQRKVLFVRCNVLRCVSE